MLGRVGDNLFVRQPGHGPLWYNMYYSDKIPDYEHSVWAHALAGGRINYHPIYPSKSGSSKRDLVLLEGDLMG